MKSEEEQETVRFNLTPDGLRITIFDRTRKPIFEANSDKLTEYGSWILSTLAWEISRYETFAVELEGHTERGYRPVRNNYTGWELSADRANSGRRKLLEHGVRAGQFKKVAGFADTMPLPDTRPEDPLNRRITLMLRVKSEHPQS
jgi:chemotaxis protein MotB